MSTGLWVIVIILILVFRRRIRNFGSNIRNFGSNIRNWKFNAKVVDSTSGQTNSLLANAYFQKTEVPQYYETFDQLYASDNLKDELKMQSEIEPKKLNDMYLAVRRCEMYCREIGLQVKFKNELDLRSFKLKQNETLVFSVVGLTSVMSFFMLIYHLYYRQNSSCSIF